MVSISDKMQDNDRLHTNEMSNNNCDTVNVFSETEDVSVFAVDMPGNELNNDWNVQMYVKNSPLKMEIDTGASCNVLSLGTLNCLGVKYHLQRIRCLLKVYMDRV